MAPTTEPPCPCQVRNALAWAAAYLKARGSSTPRLDAEVLLQTLLRLDRAGLLVSGDRWLARAEWAAFYRLVARRGAGEPVAYLTGTKEFWSRPLTVTPDVLIPRPETEVLVALALKRARECERADAGPLRILDLGTGSGAVAVTLACELPGAQVTATDLSEAALEVARANAARHGATVTFLRGDGLAAVRPDARFELLCANLPYVPSDDPRLDPGVRRYEPRAAWDGGPDGLAALRSVIPQAPRFVTPGGWLLLEIGEGQAEAVAGLIAATGEFEPAARWPDLSGSVRVVEARRTEA